MFKNSLSARFYAAFALSLVVTAVTLPLPMGAEPSSSMQASAVPRASLPTVVFRTELPGGTGQSTDPDG